MTTSCEVDNPKGKANRKQVCFSDKELEIYGQFLADKGKFSTYVKRLIEQDFNNAQPIQNNSSDLDLKFEELKQFISQQIKESKQAPIVVQMQSPVQVPQQASPMVKHEPKPIVPEQAVQEQKDDVKTEVNKAEVKSKAASFNKFRKKKEEEEQEEQ